MIDGQFNKQSAKIAYTYGKKWMPNSHCGYIHKNEGKIRVSRVKLLKNLVGNTGKYLQDP